MPAGLSNIVGLKPSRGLVSTAGVVPACRTLDCVSVFALTVDDATAVLSAIAGPGHADAIRTAAAAGRAGPMPDGLRLGVPIAGQRLFFGDRASEQLTRRRWRDSRNSARRSSRSTSSRSTQRRACSTRGPGSPNAIRRSRALIASSPESLHPVTRQIILAGAHGTAADAFAAFYQLDDLRRVRDHTFRASTRWCCRPRRRSIPSNRC